MLLPSLGGAEDVTTVVSVECGTTFFSNESRTTVVFEECWTIVISEESGTTVVSEEWGTVVILEESRTTVASEGWGTVVVSIDCGRAIVSAEWGTAAVSEDWEIAAVSVVSSECAGYWIRDMMLQNTRVSAISKIVISNSPNSSLGTSFFNLSTTEFGTKKVTIKDPNATLVFSIRAKLHSLWRFANFSLNSSTFCNVGSFKMSLEQRFVFRYVRRGKFS